MRLIDRLSHEVAVPRQTEIAAVGEQRLAGQPPKSGQFTCYKTGQIYLLPTTPAELTCNSFV